MRLDRKVQFMRRDGGTDSGYGVQYKHIKHGGLVSANRQDVSDSEKAVAGWVVATIVARFTVRSSAFTRDLTPIDQLIQGGKTWDIQGIKEAKQARHAFLEITARARADV